MLSNRLLTAQIAVAAAMALTNGSPPLVMAAEWAPQPTLERWRFNCRLMATWGTL